MKIDNKIIIMLSWGEETSHAQRETAEIDLIQVIDPLLHIWNKANPNVTISIKQD